MRDVYLSVLGLDPYDLVHDIVAPPIQALVSDSQLRVKHPEKAEPSLREHLYRQVKDLIVRQRVIVEVELVVREHER